MVYSVPLSLDAEQNIQGLFTTLTSGAQLVFIFTDSSKLSHYLRAAANSLAGSGRKVGSTQMEADSFEDLIATLLKMDPSMTGTVTFLPDSDPMFEQILAQMQ